MCQLGFAGMKRRFESLHTVEEFIEEVLKLVQINLSYLGLDVLCVSVLTAISYRRVSRSQRKPSYLVSMLIIINNNSGN